MFDFTSLLRTAQNGISNQSRKVRRISHGLAYENQSGRRVGLLDTEIGLNSADFMLTLCIRLLEL